MKSEAVEAIRDESTSTPAALKFTAEKHSHCLGKGVMAGLIGGLIGTIMMNEFQAAWSKASKAMQNGSGQGQQEQGQQESEDATMKAAGKLARVGGKELSHEQKKRLGPVVHYSFGTLQGAVYGMMTELTGTDGGFLPGMLFGATLFALADEVGVPYLGLGSKPGESPLSTHLYGLSAHLVYGMCTEFARRGLRAAL